MREEIVIGNSDYIRKQLEEKKARREQLWAEEKTPKPEVRQVIPRWIVGGILGLLAWNGINSYHIWKESQFRDGVDIRLGRQINTLFDNQQILWNRQEEVKRK